MTELYIIRHCQATGQEAEAELTDIGKLQAIELADSLQSVGIDYIVTSTYERARCTIEPLAQRIGLPVNEDERLIERVLCGNSHQNWREMLRRTYDEPELCYEGGESSCAAVERALQVVQSILSASYERPALVSHGNLISLLLRHYESSFGFAEWERLSNPDVYVIKMQPEHTVIERVWV
ncbi:histidine phosphatase family protein [Paenibacillus kandeliae]|uniref:histidine phosphatase family protein n=1 Tax=Paenibacillus kandeliae TaxID=3231269 RepID=UPI00345864DB